MAERWIHYDFCRDGLSPARNAMHQQRGSEQELEAKTAETGVRQIPVTAIRANRNQPRSFFNEQALDELAASIREHGLIQPIIVSEHGEGYELIAGERRWRAVQRAGLESIPALIKRATPQQLLELALVENIQRADLNVLEEARAYQTLKDEFGLSDALIARRVGKSRVAVVNTRRLIRLLPEARQALLDQTISAGHGRALLRFEVPTEQVAALTLLLHHGMSVREVERLAELALHNRLDPAVRLALLDGRSTMAQAQLLLRVDDLADQRALLDRLLAQGLRVDELERVVSRLATGLDFAEALSPHDAHPVTLRKPQSRRAVADQADPEDEEAERLFELLLETPVAIARTAGAIRLTITLFDDTQLQALYDRLGGASC